MTTAEPDYLDAMRHAMAEEQREWHAIRGERVAAGLSPTAFEVSEEQRRRMSERGETSPTDLFLLALDVMDS